MDNSNIPDNNGERIDSSSDIISQDPFHISENNNNGMVSPLPEGINEPNENSSSPVETFDILNSNATNNAPETIPSIEEPQIVEQNFVPDDITPQGINEPVNNMPMTEQANSFNPNVTELVDESKLDPALLERLSMIYIGSKYEKFGKLLNFAAGIFTFIYAFYRKMYLLGFIIIIIETIMGLFLKNPLFTLIINVAMLFGFNFLYILHVKRKVTKIKTKKKNKDKPVNEINNLCAISGGTSAGMAIVSIIISLVIAFALAFIFNLLGLFKSSFGLNVDSIKDVPSAIKELYNEVTSEYLGSPDGNYRGAVIANFDEDMNKSYTISISPKFTNATTTLHTFSYEFYDEGINNPTCVFTFFQARGFNNGEELVDKIKEYDSKHGLKVTSKEENNINNIDWSYIISSSSKSDIYYYGTTKNNKAYLAQYIVSKEKSDCLSYKDEIINSINEIN